MVSTEVRTRSKTRDDDEPNTKRSRRPSDEDEDEETDDDEDDDNDEKPTRSASGKRKSSRDSDDDDSDDDSSEDEKPAKEAKRKLVKVYTPRFRASFAHVFKPHAFDEGEKAKYMIDMIFNPSADLTELEREIERAAIAMFGPKKQWPKGLEFPIKDGNDKPDIKAYKDKLIAKAKSDYKPGIVDQDNNPIDDDNAEDFYSGCYATATVFPMAYAKGRNKGVTLILGNIKKLKDGEHLGGRTSAKQDFENVGDADNQDDDEDEKPRKKSSTKSKARSRDDDEDDD